MIKNVCKPLEFIADLLLIIAMLGVFVGVVMALSMQKWIPFLICCGSGFGLLITSLLLKGYSQLIDNSNYMCEALDRLSRNASVNQDLHSNELPDL